MPRCVGRVVICHLFPMSMFKNDVFSYLPWTSPTTFGTYTPRGQSLPRYAKGSENYDRKAFSAKLHYHFSTRHPNDLSHMSHPCGSDRGPFCKPMGDSGELIHTPLVSARGHDCLWTAAESYLRSHLELPVGIEL